MNIIHPREVMAMGPKKAEHYWSEHRVEYEYPTHRCYRTLKVLQFLKGHPWNEEALAWVNSVRPSCIRVTSGWTTTDSIMWRVTVYVDHATKLITRIEQECELGGEAYMKPIPTPKEVP